MPKVLEIIAEAALHIATDTHRAYPQIPWRRIIRPRNRVLHGDFDINLDLIPQTANNKIGSYRQIVALDAR